MDEYSGLMPIKHFIRANWFILWGVLLSTTVVNIAIGYSMYINMKEMREEVKESSKKVIALSSSGHMIYSEKQSIDVGSEEFKKVLKNILVDKLILDAKKMTKDFSVMPKTEEQLVSNYEPLEDFYKHFLHENGFEDFVFFIRETGKLVARENLVEMATPMESKVTRYVGNTKGFEIDIVSRCALSYYLEEVDKNKNGFATVTISASGDFNPAKGTIANPLGIQFKSLKVTLIEKPRGK